MNGKGYDENGNIIYEISNGNGSIKEYDNKDKLIFEGEYLNWIRWNGKIYEEDFEKKLKFKDDYINGIKIRKEFDYNLKLCDQRKLNQKKNISIYWFSTKKYLNYIHTLFL